MIESNICTTIEQSKSLIKLGLDVNTHDMWYEDYDEIHVGKHSDIINNGYLYRKDYVLPAWSLTNLLSILPKRIIFEERIYRPILCSNYKGYYWMEYIDDCFDNILKETDNYDTPIDVVHEMLVFLFKEGYIKQDV